MPSGHLVMEFIRNFFGRPSEEVVRLVDEEPASALRRKEEFLTFYGGSELVPEVGSLEPLQRGAMRPLVSHTLADVAMAGVASAGGADRYQLSLEDDLAYQLQSLLLYADSLGLRDPFSASFGFVERGPDLVLDRQLQISDHDFLTALKILCRIPDLLDAGVVQLYSPPTLPESFDISDSSIIELVHQLLGRRLIDLIDQHDLKRKAALLIERALHQILPAATETDDRRSSLFLPDRVDKVVLTEIMATRDGGSRVSEFDTADPDERLLADLIRLRLPGVPDIDLREMVKIRGDDSFTIFRSSIADAMSACESAVESGNIAAARRIVSEHMVESKSTLAASTAGGVLADKVAGDIVGWTGGVVASFAATDWKAGIAVLASKSAYELSKNVSRSRTAMRRHYTALSRAKTDWEHRDVSPSEEKLRRKAAAKRRLGSFLRGEDE